MRVPHSLLCGIAGLWLGCTPHNNSSSQAVGQAAGQAAGQNGGNQCTNAPTSSSGSGCTLTQGYWKNHASAWPVQTLTIGGVSYTQDELLAIFNTAPAGDASLILAHQLIAAMLNVASGAVPPSASAQAIADAQAWMTANLPAGGKLPYGVSSSSAAGAAASSLTDALDQFNMGGAGVAHCTDGPGSSGMTVADGGCTGGGSGGGDHGGSGDNGDGGANGGKPPSIGSGTGTGTSVDAGGVL
jgi:hypothetical protein